MIRLYTHPFSIVPWRVRIALHEKQLEYEIEEADIFSAEAAPEFLEINPFAQIPVVDHDGFVVAESMAILEYLEETFPEPPLLPSEPKDRATIRQLMCWCTDYWPPAWKKWMAPRMPKALADAWTDASVDEGRQSICNHLDVLERQLGKSDWLVGDYSLADVCYAPFVLVLERVDLADAVAERSAVYKWVERLKGRRAVVETMMPPGPSDG